jgi:hypothetical protein
MTWANAADLCAPFHLRSLAPGSPSSRFEIYPRHPNHAISSILKLPMYLALIGSDRDSNCDSKVPLDKTNFRIYYEVIENGAEGIREKYFTAPRAGHEWRESLYRHQRCSKASDCGRLSRQAADHPWSAQDPSRIKEPALLASKVALPTTIEMLATI